MNSLIVTCFNAFSAHFSPPLSNEKQAFQSQIISLFALPPIETYLGPKVMAGLYICARYIVFNARGGLF